MNKKSHTNVGDVQAESSSDSQNEELYKPKELEPIEIGVKIRVIKQRLKGNKNSYFFLIPDDPGPAIEVQKIAKDKQKAVKDLKYDFYRENVLGGQ